MRKPSLLIAATCYFIAFASAAHARSAYDGSWDLLFVTQRGACDSSYSFTVDVDQRNVTHPNLVRFRGYVAKSGSVRASVTVQDKYASDGQTRRSLRPWDLERPLRNCTMLWVLDNATPLKRDGRNARAAGTGCFFCAELSLVGVLILRFGELKPT